MAIPEQAVGDFLVLSPQGRLAMGGPAEEFEQRVQELVAEGHIQLVADLRAVPQLDSSGIRALVRGHTTTQRFGGSFRLVGPSALVRGILQMTRLISILPIFDSVEAATRPPAERASG